MEKTEFHLTTPKRKKRVRVSANCPFPIPIASWCFFRPNIFQWRIAEGELHGTSVLVSNPQDMDNIYYSGYFGKGNLSTRGLDYSRKQDEFVNQQSRVAKNTMCLKRISRRRYLSHLHWAHDQSESSSTNETDDKSEILPYPKKCNLMSAEKISACSQMPADEIQRMEVSESVESTICDISVNVTNRSHRTNDSDFDSSARMKENSLYSVEVDKELPAQGCDKISVDPWENETEESNAFWSEETPLMDSINFSEVCPTENLKIGPCKSLEKVCKNSTNDSQLVNKSSAEVRTESNENKLGGSVSISGSLIHEDVNQYSDINLEPSSSRKVKDDKETSGDNSCVDSTITLPGGSEASRQADNIKIDLMNAEDFDERCISEDDEADVWVVSDSSDSEMEDNVVLNRAKWKNVAKKDPFPMKEQLQLGLEEAFFLSYGLGCLVVKEMNQPLPLLFLWRRFTQLNSDFIPRYVVYHNLRSKGWVPRSGIKYGADFVVYKQGPPFYHSTYLVFIRVVREGDTVASSESELSWTELACLNRVTEQVNKEVLFCYVIRPKDLQDDELSNPRCIQRFKVSEVVIRRWISKRERDNAEYLQLP